MSDPWEALKARAQVLDAGDLDLSRPAPGTRMSAAEFLAVMERCIARLQEQELRGGALQD